MSWMIENELMIQNPDLSEGFLQLYSSITVENAGESLVVLLHAFILEAGFRPKGIEKDDVYKRMPDNWKHSGNYKIQYNHELAPEAFCWVTFVPTNDILFLHGNTESEDAQDRVLYINLPFNTYLNREPVLSNPSSVFKKTEELTKSFRDEFCYPLLSLLKDEPFGLSGLVDDVKVSIMKFLPVESVLSLSEVSKAFRNATNSSYLWKCFFKRDFGLKCRDTASTSEEDWKKIYKMEYLKRRYREDTYITGHFPSTGEFPTHYWEDFPSDIYADIDPGIDMDPALQQAFPQMRARFRRHNLFTPYDVFGRFRFT